MKADKLSFPYPVLGVSDDVSGSYEVGVEANFEREEIRINIDHCLSNKTLEALIRNGKAIFCVELNCPQTIYRETFSSKDKKQTIVVNSSDLRQKVVVAFYVIANDTINAYKIEGANQDYSGYKFDIEKGDVLAYGGSRSFIAGKTWEDLKATSTFMEIQQYNEKSGPAKFVLSDEKIIIQLSQEDYTKYGNNYKVRSFLPIFHSSIVFPALIYALSEMMGENKDSYCDALWYQVIDVRRQQEQKLREIGWDVSKIPDIAQALLDNPVGKGLHSIEKIINQEIFEEE